MSGRFTLLRGALLLPLCSLVLRAQNPPPTPPAQPPVAAPVVVTPPQGTAAQQAAQQATGRPVTPEQIGNAIRQSGLNQEQIQARLRQAGYDPALADPFFGGGRGGAGQAAAGAAGNSEFAQALQSLGLLSVPTNDAKAEETPRISPDNLSPRIGGVFGREVFNRSATVFDPVTSGPVDAAYRLGIGDQLQLVVTGQLELAYGLEVRRDGTVIVPQVGQISLAGLTLEAARAFLRERMGRSYSSLNTGDARLDLSISRLRSNAVFVIGEVESPGAYQVNGLATVFQAVARAGGPSDRGSFRNIEVRRANKVIQRLDLYDYLLRGDASGDIRLEQGDQIYIPLNKRVVAVMGNVRRPRIFELRDNEGFGDLLEFAGGFLATASLDRVRIDRILPPSQRQPGRERVQVDVELHGNIDSLSRVPLLDGDIISVLAIGNLRRNVVTISGQVFQQGQFELRPAMTLSDLIADAQGLLPWALSDRIKVIRSLPLSGRSIIHNVDVSTSPGRSFLMEEFDAVEVLDARVGFPGGMVSVEGAVNAPGGRAFVERETLRDAIERAGGVREEAQKINVFRRRVGPTYNDTTSIRFEFAVPTDFVRDTSLRNFLLERDDRVVVLASPGYRAQRFATVTGNFKYPGAYAITENVDRVRDLIHRAGDALPGSYPASFRLSRGGLDVSIDYTRVMAGDESHNIQILAGDNVTIEHDPNTVKVTGAVIRSSLIRFRPGLSLQDYVELAGGPTDRADQGKAVVQYPSGIARRVRRVGFFFHTSPEVISGSTITVPERPASTGSASDTWQRVFASATALASLVLAYAAVTR
jgi:polysaccharide export outer membrane protein